MISVHEMLEPRRPRRPFSAPLREALNPETRTVRRAQVLITRCPQRRAAACPVR